MTKNLTITIQRIQPQQKQTAITQIAPQKRRIDWDIYAETDRALALRQQYMDIDEAIEIELDALRQIEKNPNSTERQITAAMRRKLQVLKQRATNTAKLQKLDQIIDRNYAQLNAR